MLDVFDRARVVALELLRAAKFLVCEHEPRLRGLELRFRLGEPDLIRHRVDREQQIALMDDVAVLEVDSGQRAADLRAQLDLIDC